MTTRSATPDIMGAVLAGNDQPLASSLRIADIRRDGGTQPRAGLDEVHVSDLVAALAAGETLPPVDVMYDGATYWLYDGYHRVEATSRAGKYTVLAIIHQGDQVAAQWASYAANSRHGLKRTNEDKRRAVLAALRHPNAAGMSNVQIAAHVGVDEGTIRNHRSQMEATSEIPKSATRTGADGRTINTANIGSNQPQYAEVSRLQQVVRDEASRYYRAYDDKLAAAMMRSSARERDGFFRTCESALLANLEYRKSDLTQAINNVAAQMEADANYSTADIASREAAADEAERQAQASTGSRTDIGNRPATTAATEPAPVAEVLDADPWFVALSMTGRFQERTEALARAITPWIADYRDSRGRTWREIENPSHSNGQLWIDFNAHAARRGAGLQLGTNGVVAKNAIDLAIQWLRAKTATANQPAATALTDLPVVATTATATSTRYQVAASNLRSAMQALAAAADAIRGLDDYVVNSIDSATSRLRQVAATCVERGEPQSEQPPAAAPAPEPPPAPTELPAELVAAGWSLTTMRGKHYASVTVPNEPEPIRTIGRGDVAATIRDAEYMHRNLRIGVTA